MKCGLRWQRGKPVPRHSLNAQVGRWNWWKPAWVDCHWTYIGPSKLRTHGNLMYITKEGSRVSWLVTQTGFGASFGREVRLTSG